MPPMRAFLFLSALVVLTAGCRRGEPSAPTRTEPALPVTVVAVKLATQPALLEMPATVRPAERAVIAAKLTGTIAALPWGLGQEVQAGEILVTLSMPETEARVRQAQAQLAESRRAAERERTLVTQGVNPPDVLRDAEDRLRYAEAALAEAEALLAQAQLRAPFAGVITEKHALPGDLATPGLPLLTLEATARLRAEGALPEQAAATLRLGDSLSVIVQDNAAPVTGRIEELSAAADALSRSVLVKVALPDGSARSGQFARLLVTTGTTDIVSVPATAVSRFGQMERVFVVQENRVALRLVKTGRVVSDRIEILSGLAPGEPVVLAPPPSLRDGQRVVPQP